MPRKTKSKGKKPDPGGVDTPAKENRAKVAFEEHKKRMGAFRMGMPENAEGRPVPPFSSPYVHGMPYGPLPDPRSGRPPYPPSHQAPMLGPVVSRGSLFENLGNMLRLGVDVINAGLASGLQLIEGLHGQGPESCSPHDDCSCCDTSGCDSCSCHHGHSGHCCPPTSGRCCQCCNPSVHGC